MKALKRVASVLLALLWDCERPLCSLWSGYWLMRYGDFPNVLDPWKAWRAVASHHTVYQWSVLVICDYKGQKIPELKENVDICIAPLLIYPITINETWFSCYSIAALLKHESLATCYQCCVCLSLLLYFNWCTQVLHPWQQGIWSPSSFPAVHPRTPQLKLSYMVISSFLETENKAGFIIIIFYFKISYLLIWTGWDKNQYFFIFFLIPIGLIHVFSHVRFLNWQDT